MIWIVVILWDETGLIFLYLSAPLFRCFAAIYGYTDDQFFMTYQRKKKKKTRGSNGGPWRTDLSLMLQIATRIGNPALYIIQGKP